MSVSSSQVMGGACTQVMPETINQDMNGLCRSRHSAGLANTGPHLLFAHRDELQMADDSVLIDKEGARKAEDAVTEGGRSVRVQDRLQAVEPERVEERPGLLA